MSDRTRHPLVTRAGLAPRGVCARRGLTLAELIIGTAMLGIVMMAAAGLMMAVAAGWTNGETSMRTASVNDRAGLRVEEALSGAFYALQVKEPATEGAASYVFFWQSDGITGAADNKAQLGEMALVEFDPTTKAVRLYQSVPAASMTPAQLAAAQASDWGDPTSAAIVTYFKQQTFVTAPVVLIGGTGGGATVTAATFRSYTTSGAKPMFSYALTLKQNNLTVSRQGTVTLRIAQKPKNVS